MRIAIIGGHGKVALLLAPLLREAGHEVDAIIRNPDHAEEVAAGGALPVVADVEQLDTDALTDLLAGHDLVVWSAGAGGGSPERTYAVDRDAAIRSMEAATRAGVGRYVMVSYFGAGPDHGVPEDNGFFAYAEAKAAADEHLRSSSLDWVVLGPSGLTLDPPTGSIEVATPGSGVEGGTVSRGNVARVIAAVVERPELSGRTIEFNDGPAPVAEALDALRG
ncbi:SDR family oxidoreductase [Ornithinimicrobium humiphilum]|uniref:Putative NADH-flavin reductase n=1 Tax=Ornithinimicrobium humiphilum TaxID=125288 RepID=A0A543KL04_9MICO|nr:SDR family oxidoreductase [Ornithinimicrobium humiphilum]TQM95700.1 putative NADH-flavin reductase [Ornithinimicrobium humiphilum]